LNTETATESRSTKCRALRLAYFSQETYGGLADYAREQTRALSNAGALVSVITAPSVVEVYRDSAREVVPLLAEVPAAGTTNRWLRRWRTMHWILGNMRRLAAWLEREQVKCVLFSAFMEYYAPLWVAPFQTLAKNGVVFGSVIHDPIRSTRLGPRWWQRRSIAANYSFLSEAFVHDDIELDTVRAVAGLHTTVIPHGPYPFSSAKLRREVVREQLQIPTHGLLLLAFGHLRDAKNLDLVLRAMPSQPDTFLLVAGKELSGNQRPAVYYQELATQLGVADRCRWRIGFVAEHEIGNLFEAADLVLLTYNGQFRSASGVLNVAAQYKKPCLASGGQGNLKTSVTKYRLGQWIEPDNTEAISRGLALNWRNAAAQANWQEYKHDNSWDRNAALVLQRFALHPTPSSRLMSSI